ncbi:hypothetical protein F0L74_17410 [Chitinophaga agrisoli]|uniref:C-terminal processing protease CtpA/Prc n=1 Tax=Chitinophaga agrisoli TaxID=2607653 RepID=A0A5B2VTT1_9BACT|nr:S41 family peptidase [Chitinophaga agrisoli]KAA2241656.1 hypothetical protein F0L74_17410 [Chitinophaga agrisoli]
MPQYNRLYRVLSVPVWLLLMAACTKDKTPPTPTGPVTQKEINNWILDSMHYFYLWSDQLPGKAEEQTETQAFFNKLKNPADRFSIIYNPEVPETYPRYMLFTYGIDFSIINWPTAPGGAIGVIKLVLPGSTAGFSGLKRGDYFTRINGQAISSSNAGTLGENMLQQQSVSLTPATVQGNTVTEGTALTLPAGNIAEDPVHNHSILTVNGKKVAYLFYNYFNDAYNLPLTGIFQQFKDAGVSELILDLRYNPGGSVTASALLSALIAPGINEQSGFVRYTGNKYMGQRTISFQSALSVPEAGAPVSFSSLSPTRLSLPRVFILSGHETTSAAELTINNLRPYTNVVQIGEPTYGKDKGAIIISDLRTPKRIPWTMLPITYYLANVKGEGGYTQGITPLYTIDELSTQPLSPLGSTRDPLIAKAISIISGNGRITGETHPVSPTLRLYDAGKRMADGNIVTLPASLLRK